MRKSVKNLIATGLVTAAMASAPMVFAAASSNTQNSGQTGQMMQNNGRMANDMGMMGGSMMSMQRNAAQGSGQAGPMMGNNGRMGSGTGMMNGGSMMAMMHMMATCNQMMQGMMGMASTGMTNGGMMNSRNTMPMMQGRMDHGPGGQSK